MHASSLHVHSEVADRLAWLQDGGELDEYPGYGWADPDHHEPTPREEAEWAGMAPHSGFWVEGEDDPNDLRANTLSDLGFFNEYLFPSGREGGAL